MMSYYQIYLHLFISGILYVNMLEKCIYSSGEVEYSHLIFFYAVIIIIFIIIYKYTDY